MYVQVHALNILRALYRDTRLGENIVPFVSDGMQAAILGFTSPVWAVSISFSLFIDNFCVSSFDNRKYGFGGWLQNMYLKVPSSTSWHNIPVSLK